MRPEFVHHEEKVKEDIITGFSYLMGEHGEGKARLF